MKRSFVDDDMSKPGIVPGSWHPENTETDRVPDKGISFKLDSG